MLLRCYIATPIHQDGLDILSAAGLTISHASAQNAETVLREIVDADAVIVRNGGLTGEAMRAAPKLKAIGQHGTGYDRIDLPTSKELGIPVTNTPFANVQSVAEHVIAQMMGIAKRLREGDRAMRENRYDYRYQPVFFELTGKTLLVIGFGQIGQRTAAMCKAAFGMRVFVHSPSVPVAFIEEAGCLPAPDIDTVLPQVDIVSLHQRLTPQTRGEFNQRRFALMKKGAMLVNTARGALVDEQALIDAVNSGHLSGAAMDVFEPEPLPPGHPYTSCDGILLSPHSAGAAQEALSRTAIDAAHEVIAVLEGRKPRYLVNGVWENRRR